MDLASGAWIENRLQQLLEPFRGLVEGEGTLFLVGGAVRDWLLGLDVQDLDFLVQGDARRIARKAADQLGGSFFPMDEERQIYRVIFSDENQHRQVVDFSGLRAEDLEGDLRGRDFTINALAVDVWIPDSIIDPLKGRQDLIDRRLRACSCSSFSDDPIRTIRAVRMANAFRLRMERETIDWLRQAVPLLLQVSEERKRDEVFKILDGERAASSLRLMQSLGIVGMLYPELAVLYNGSQASPYAMDVWEHTLAAMNSLEVIFDLLLKPMTDESVSSLFIGTMALRLKPFKAGLAEHYQKRIHLDRSLRSLLMFAALFHDSGKPASLNVDEKNQVHYCGHDAAGEKIIARRARACCLSRDEVQWLQRVIGNHMCIHFLGKTPQPLSRREIYRFFDNARGTGVDLALLALADICATGGEPQTFERWQAELDVVAQLLSAWFNHYEEWIAPALFMDGTGLMKTWNLPEGPLVGKILNALREAQACGEVSGKEEANRFVEKYLAEIPPE